MVLKKIHSFYTENEYTDEILQSSPKLKIHQ